MLLLETLNFHCFNSDDPFQILYLLNIKSFWDNFVRVLNTILHKNFVVLLFCFLCSISPKDQPFTRCNSAEFFFIKIYLKTLCSFQFSAFQFVEFPINFSSCYNRIFALIFNDMIWRISTFLSLSSPARLKEEKFPSLLTYLKMIV